MRLSFSCHCIRCTNHRREHSQENESHTLIGLFPRKECMSVWSSRVGTGSVTWLRPERLRRRIPDSWILGWFSNRTGTSDGWRLQCARNSLDSVLIWPYLRIYSVHAVVKRSVLLLNRPNYLTVRARKNLHFPSLIFCSCFKTVEQCMQYRLFISLIN